MTLSQQLARFAVGARLEDLSAPARRQLKVRLLDALGCALGALGSQPICMLRALVDEFRGAGLCSLIGGGKAPPDRAALFNGALVRYLDFNDSYLAPGETCHPSDNLGAVLAAAEYADRSGRDLLAALAVAYQTECRLSDEAPVRAKGFDHTTQGSYAVAAGVSRALGLDAERAAHAIGISGTALNALRVTRTGRLSHWKGLAYAFTGSAATHAAFLAKHGITGPEQVFEGNKGFMDAIAGPFSIDWAAEDLERVRLTIVKKYNAEIHSQSAIEALEEIASERHMEAGEIESIEVDIFDVAYQIIGGGEEGAKTEVHSKEEADHSLPYLLAVAFLDGGVMPAQYARERIERRDVQDLLRRVTVRPHPDYSARFPEEMPCRVTVRLKDAGVRVREKRDYEGFFTRPITWDRAMRKFEVLTAPFVAEGLQQRIAETVEQMESYSARHLAGLLESASSAALGAAHGGSRR
jgi:2-methylcitrate dehydratase